MEGNFPLGWKTISPYQGYGSRSSLKRFAFYTYLFEREVIFNGNKIVLKPACLAGKYGLPDEIKSGIIPYLSIEHEAFFTLIDLKQINPKN